MLIDATLLPKRSCPRQRRAEGMEVEEGERDSRSCNSNIGRRADSQPPRAGALYQQEVHKAERKAELQYRGERRASAWLGGESRRPWRCAVRVDQRSHRRAHGHGQLAGEQSQPLLLGPVQAVKRRSKWPDCSSSRNGSVACSETSNSIRQQLRDIRQRHVVYQTSD